MLQKLKPLSARYSALQPHLPILLLLGFTLSMWSYFWGRYGILELDAHSLRWSWQYTEVLEYLILGRKAGYPAMWPREITLELLYQLHMPADFILRGLIHYIAVDNGVWGQRVYSIGLGLLTVLYTFRFGARVYSREVGIWAAAIIACHPLLVLVQAGYRMYPLLYCMAIMTSFYATVYFDKSGSGSRVFRWLILILIVLSLLLVTTHFFGILCLGAILLTYCWSRFGKGFQWRACLPFLPAILIWLTAFVILLFDLQRGNKYIEHTFFIPPLNLETLQLFLRSLIAGTQYKPMSWWLLIVILFGFAYSFWPRPSRDWKSLPFVALVVALSVCVLSFLLFRPVHEYRYFGFLLPLILPAAVHGWLHLRKDMASIMLSISLAGMLASTVISFADDTYYGIEDMVNAVQERIENGKKDEVRLMISTTSGNMGHASHFSYRLPGLQFASIPLPFDEARLVGSICGAERVWYYRTRHNFPWEKRSLELLREKFQLVWEKEFRAVYLYEFAAESDPCKPGSNDASSQEDR